MFFPGLTSEVWNPSRNRYDKKRGARNEPLDTWVYSYAAAHHPELRLHRATAADWDRREAALRELASKARAETESTPVTNPAERSVQAPAQGAEKKPSFWHSYNRTPAKGRGPRR
jgi:phage terminase large subunit GpA-like protein